MAQWVLATTFGPAIKGKCFTRVPGSTGSTLTECLESASRRKPSSIHACVNTSTQKAVRRDKGELRTMENAHLMSRIRCLEYDLGASMEVASKNKYVEGAVIQATELGLGHFGIPTFVSERVAKTGLGILDLSGEALEINATHRTRASPSPKHARNHSWI